MINIAHRGFKSQYPENTMLAFKKALEIGAEGIEFDVHLSKDGEVVIIHDETLDRTTNGEGPVGEKTLAELKKLNAGKLYSNIVDFEGIPTLKEYFDEFAKEDIITNIEIKTNIIEYPGIEQKVYDIVKDYGVEDKIIISSFNPNSLFKIKKIDENIKCGALVDRDVDNVIEIMKDNNIEYYHPKATLMNREKVEKFHNAGILINVWYEEPFSDFASDYELGLDGMITDYPDVIKTLK